MTSAGTFTIFQLRFTVKKVQRLLRLHLIRKSVFTGSGIFLYCFAGSPPWTLSTFSGSAHNPKARLILQTLIENLLSLVH